MKSLSTIIIVSFITVCVSFAASFGYIKYVENKRPESYFLDPQQAISRTEIQNIVKDFIIENPALIVESVDRMNLDQARKERERVQNYIKDNIKQIQSSKKDPRIGNPNAKIKIVEFFDYRCGYCKRMMKVKDQLLASGMDIEIVFKEFPVLGDFSEKAARASLAVNSIDKSKYISFHRDLMNYTGPTDENALLNIAKAAGISEEQYSKALKSSNIEEILEDNKKIARAIGILGSPAYLINEEYYPGALSFEEIKEIIERLSSESKK